MTDREPVRKSFYLSGASHSAPIPSAARVGPLIMTGSVSGKDPVAGAVPDELEAEFRQMFRNVEVILTEAGGSMDDIVKFEVTLRTRDQRKVLDPVWVAVFPDQHHRPARHVSAAPLPGELNVQVQVTAYVQAGPDQ